MDKVIAILLQILKVAEKLDVDIGITEDGKIKICVTVDQNALIRQSALLLPKQ